MLPVHFVSRLEVRLPRGVSLRQALHLIIKHADANRDAQQKMRHLAGEESSLQLRCGIVTMFRVRQASDFLVRIEQRQQAISVQLDRFSIERECAWRIQSGEVLTSENAFRYVTADTTAP